MDKIIKFDGLDNEFTLLNHSKEFVIEETKEDVLKWYKENCEPDEYDEKDITADYEIRETVVYRGGNDNLIVSSVSRHENGMCELPEIENTIDFVRNVLVDKMRDNKKLIISINQVEGTTLDYDLIFDENLYDELLDSFEEGIAVKVREYVCSSNSENKDIRFYKYRKITNGVMERL